MSIEIRGHLKPTDALRRHVEKRVTAAVGRMQQHIRGVTVWFDDINGPSRGGADKSCRIAITLEGPRQAPVVVEEVHWDLYKAITLAANRLSHNVRREVDRLTDSRQRSSATAL